MALLRDQLVVAEDRGIFSLCIENREIEIYRIWMGCSHVYTTYGSVVTAFAKRTWAFLSITELCCTSVRLSLITFQLRRCRMFP